MIRLKNSAVRESFLLETIEKNPGIQFREIMRKADMKNGVLSHYLGKLEKKGSVKVERTPRQTRFYSLQINSDDAKTIKALRRDTKRSIIYLSFMLNEIGISTQLGITFEEVYCV